MPDSKFNILDGNLAITVVHFELTLGILVGCEHVLVELGLQAGVALITAHAGFDIRSFLNRGLLFELLSLFTHSHNSLMFNLHIFVI